MFSNASGSVHPCLLVSLLCERLLALRLPCQPTWRSRTNPDPCQPSRAPIVTKGRCDLQRDSPRHAHVPRATGRGSPRVPPLAALSAPKPPYASGTCRKSRGARRGRSPSSGRGRGARFCLRMQYRRGPMERTSPDSMTTRKKMGRRRRWSSVASRSLSRSCSGD